MNTISTVGTGFSLDKHPLIVSSFVQITGFDAKVRSTIRDDAVLFLVFATNRPRRSQAAMRAIHVSLKREMFDKHTSGCVRVIERNGTVTHSLFTKYFREGTHDNFFPPQEVETVLTH